MSSLQSHIVQIPRNSHFRLAYTNDAGRASTIYTFTATSGATPLLTSPQTGVGASGSFGLAAWASGATPVTVNGGSAYGLLSTGQAILKDLGDTIVSAGRTFRRVQMVNTDGSNGEKNYGTYGTNDSDALVGYIELGLRGFGTPSAYARAL